MDVIEVSQKFQCKIGLNEGWPSLLADLHKAWKVGNTHKVYAKMSDVTLR